MNWKTYTAGFDTILSNENNEAPYNKESYLTYTKLNQARLNRWEKKFELSEESKSTLDAIKVPQKWILITEHWCGDAAHSAAILNKFTEYSDLIDFEVQMRDQAPFSIDKYLTNGGKSIPKLAVLAKDGNDLFNWGPRPAEIQGMVMDMKTSDLSGDEKNKIIQGWYNKDKGRSTENEILALLKGAIL